MVKIKKKQGSWMKRLPKGLKRRLTRRFEESLNTNEVKSEMQSKIEEGQHNLVNEVTLKLQKEK